MMCVLTCFLGAYDAHLTLTAFALHRPASGPAQAASRLLLDLLAVLTHAVASAWNTWSYHLTLPGPGHLRNPSPL